MDDAIRDSAAGRHEAGHEPDHHSPAAADLTPAIRYCCWCREIRIQGLDLKTDPPVGVYFHPQSAHVIRTHGNDVAVMIQDGICERCAEKLKQEKT